MDKITKDTRCSELRERLERCQYKQMLREALAWNEDQEKDPATLRTLLLVLFLKEEEDELKGASYATSSYSNIINMPAFNTMGELLVKKGLMAEKPDGFKHYFNLYGDIYSNTGNHNTASRQLFGKMPREMDGTHFYAYGLCRALQGLKDDDTIEGRLGRLKAGIEAEISESDLNSSDTDKLISSCNDNLDAYCDKLTDILKKAAPPEGSYMWIRNEIMSWIAPRDGVTQLVLTGAPGTGKTRMARNIAEELGAELAWEENQEDRQPRFELVQFHPSYDYTDFVEGLRPFEEEGKLGFRKMDGIFKRFCRNVVRHGDENRKYFFIIDEINRADLSKVFGELMYCLDKRGENRIKTQYHNLKTYDENVFADGFYIPKNVVIIGTMNDIDRSVESMDFALRRRFVWKEIEVKEKLLESAFAAMLPEQGEIDSKDVPKTLAKKVMQLNTYLSGDSGKKYVLNRHYYISQGQFADLPDQWKRLAEKGLGGVNAFLKYVWDKRIRMLIEEYVRGEEGAEEFVKACKQELMK